jgi:hypothetical protein
MTERRVRWWVLLLIALGVTAWVAPGFVMRAARTGHLTADEPQYLMTAISLGEDLDLDISDERTEQRFRDFHRGNLPMQETVRDDGRLVSPHDPLLPVYLALPTLIGGWIGAKIALAALAGLLAAVLVWIAVVRFGLSTRASVITVLAFAAGAPFAMYGTQVYPELPAALVVALAVAALTGPLGRRGLLATAACVIALPWLSVKYVPVAAALAVLAAFMCRRRGGDTSRVAWFAGGLAGAGALFLAAHQAWYGGWTVYASGDHFVGGELDVVGFSPNYPGRAIRLVGLLVDRDFGLAAWNPLYLLAVPALVLLLVRRPTGWPVLAMPLAVGWLNATFVALTMHGWWWPGRQVVVVLPCAVLAVAWLAASNTYALRTVAAFGAFGAAVFMWFVFEASVGDLRLVVTFEDTTNPLVQAWRVLLPDYREGATRDWILHAFWLAALAGTVFGIVHPRLASLRSRLVRIEMKEST